MVGLVLVSHSRQLAEAACRLAKGVGKAELPIDFAGGAGDDHSELGTDATDIMDAINRVNAGDGVVVLMDLGSAVLSARLAKQMLDDDVPNIRLCPAPLVEGAVAAAIQVGAGAGIDAVVKEAKNALAAKLREIEEGDGEPDGDVSAAPAPGDDATRKSAVPADALRLRFTLDDPNGMHTRPAAEFVKAIGGFDSEVRIRNCFNDDPFVDARSLTQIALSNIRHGDVAEIAVWGPQAAETVDAVRTLVRDTYHGSEVADTVVVPKAPPPEPEPAGSAGMSRLAPGVAVGTLYYPPSDISEIPPMKAADPEAEIARLDAAIEKSRAFMEEQKGLFGEERKGEEAILDALLLILDDKEILDSVRKAIRAEKLDAAYAYQRRMLDLAKQYHALPSAYMRERGTDVIGVSEHVIAALEGREDADIAGLSDVIVYSPEVTPIQVGMWPKGQLIGILTGEGGPTSHVAILARSLGIPAITGYEPPPLAATGDRVVMDANALEVEVKPSEARLREFEARRKGWLEHVARDAADSKGPAVTRDGVSIPVLANVGDAATSAAAASGGAEGIGLLRTEFLFLDKRLPPDEEEQTRQLEGIFKPFAGLPVTVRTLDAGGDKPMPWLAMPPEANPFLGVRGVRLMQREAGAFKTQLRAILRAGAGAKLEIMIPMIATVDEVEFCREALDECHGELAAAKAEHCWPVRFGIMVETPAAALQAEKLASLVDFFSIGTNDLTQYVMCVERGNKALIRLSDSMHPAVLKAIGMVTAGAAAHGVSVAVCGEMAGDPVAARALLGLGVDHLSLNANAIGPVKRAIRRASVGELREKAAKAVAMASAEETRRLFGEGGDS